MAKPVIAMKAGDVVINKFKLTNSIIKHWMYSAECADVFGGISPGSEFKVIETQSVRHPFWIILAIPGRDPVASLKLSAQEFVMQFA